MKEPTQKTIRRVAVMLAAAYWRGRFEGAGFEKDTGAMDRAIFAAAEAGAEEWSKVAQKALMALSRNGGSTTSRSLNRKSL